MRAVKKSKIKMRKSTRYFYIALASILFAISTAILFGNFFGGKTDKIKEEVYSYTNKFQYDYKVNLLKNKYIENTTLDMSESAYITDLMDTIDMNLHYTYQSDEKSTIKYTYGIKAVLNGVYTKDGEEQKIWAKEQVLKEPTENTAIDEKLDITENLVLNLKDQNQLVKDFEQEIGISIDATYNLVLDVQTNTQVNGKQVDNHYISTVSIDLGKKTTRIQGENNKSDTQYVSQEIEQTPETSTFVKVLGIIMLAVSIYIFRFVFIKTVPMNKTRNEFRLELNRILRLCQDKIVQVSSNLEVDTTNVIDVRDFGEIVKVSEELFKPILYWISPRDDEAWFTVMSHGVTYRYILKK